MQFFCKDADVKLFVSSILLFTFCWLLVTFSLLLVTLCWILVSLSLLPVKFLWSFVILWLLLITVWSLLVTFYLLLVFSTPYSLLKTIPYELWFLVVRNFWKDLASLFCSVLTLELRRLANWEQENFFVVWFAHLSFTFSIRKMNFGDKFF